MPAHPMGKCAMTSGDLEVFGQANQLTQDRDNMSGTRLKEKIFDVGSRSSDKFITFTVRS